MQRGRRRMALLCCGVGLAVAWLLWPRERLLLDRATRIADARHWQDDAYFWMSDHELLLFKNQPYDLVRPIRYDLQTQHEETIAPLYTALKHEASLLTGGRFLEFQSLSPSGKWLLCKRGQISGPPIAACSLEGKPTVRSPIKGRWGQWLPDSSGWIEQEASYTGGRFMVDFQSVLHSESKIVRIDGVPEVFDVAGGRDDGTVLVTSSVDGPSYPANRGRLKWYIVPASGGRARLFETSIPDWVRGVSCYVSPRGTRVLWVFFPTGPPPHPPTLADRMRRLLRLRSENPKVAYWVSRADGANLHELGVMREPYGWAPIQSLRWTPDERRISFVHRGSLYTVPAD